MSIPVIVLRTFVSRCPMSNWTNDGYCRFEGTGDSVQEALSKLFLHFREKHIDRVVSFKDVDERS